jgi:SP family general alpha glucoside:H+ symporter-like MFS transporter
MNSLRRLNGNISGYDVESEYAIVSTEVEAAERLRVEQKRAKWSEIFTGTDGRRFLISAAIPMYGQLVGGAVVFTYTSFFFQQAGLENPFLASLIVFILLEAFIAVSFFTTDLVGRRPLLLGAIVVIVISLLSIGIAGTVTQNGASENALIALACIWVVAYASGIAPIGSIYQGESSTPRLRAKTNSVSQAMGQTFG